MEVVPQTTKPNQMPPFLADKNHYKIAMSSKRKCPISSFMKNSKGRNQAQADGTFNLALVTPVGSN